MAVVTVKTSSTHKTIETDVRMPIRDIFEMANADPGEAQVMCGAKPIDNLNMTLEQLGKTNEDHIFLSAIVKSENAAGIKISAGTYVIVSDYTPEEIAKIAKYCPDAMYLFEPSPCGTNAKVITYSVGVGTGYGSMEKKIAMFGEYDVGGKACLTVPFVTVEGMTAEESFAEIYGDSYRKLMEVQNGWAEALKAADAAKKVVLDAFETETHAE